MTRIICDTMIWYELSKNRLEIPNSKEYSLVCTYLSLTELAFTPNNFKYLEEVQNAIRKILSTEPELIMKHPFDYARTLIDSDFNPEYKIEEDLIMAFIRVILNHPKEGLIENEFKNQIAYVVSKRKENTTEWATFLNQMYAPMKQIGGTLKKYHSEEFDEMEFRNRLVFQLNQLSDKIYSDQSINWSYFELYGKVSRRYRRNLRVSKMKADKNDENDLKNMIYVQPGDKYWTLEKRWLSIFKEAKLDEYVYSQS